MTIRFKKVREFERLSMMQEIEKEMLKDDLDDIYTLDNREVDVDPDEIMEYALIEGYMSA